MKTFQGLCSVRRVFDFAVMPFIIIIIPSWVQEDAADEHRPREGENICAIL